MTHATLPEPQTRTDTETRILVRDDLNHRVIEKETLRDGSVVWVASDTELDGCIAQADTFEGALAALDAAREQYRDSLRELHNTPPSRPPKVASSGKTNSVSPGVFFFGIFPGTRSR